jgi:hypothetical protein
MIMYCPEVLQDTIWIVLNSYQLLSYTPGEGDTCTLEVVSEKRMIEQPASDTDHRDSYYQLAHTTENNMAVLIE